MLKKQIERNVSKRYAEAIQKKFCVKYTLPCALHIISQELIEHSVHTIPESKISGVVTVHVWRWRDRIAARHAAIIRVVHGVSAMVYSPNR